MIPASYLFKDVYKQSWEDAADAPTVIEHRNRFLDGLMTPIAGAVAAVFHRRDRYSSAFITGETKTSW